jgi:hypothetical protein
MRPTCTLLLALLLTTACVGTDTEDDNNFVPFTPDMDMSGQDGAVEADMPAGADMGDMPGADMADMDAPSDMADMAPGDMGDMGSGVCTPNMDGMITQAEVPTVKGAFATYRVATDATVSTAGEVQADGTRIWDLTGMLPGDRRLLVEAQDATGRWFSTDYPDASYVARLAESSDLLGIFKITDGALQLLGIASPQDSATATKLKHTPAVNTLKYPLKKGETWSSNASVTGTYNGIPFTTYTEKYVSQVDAEGIMKTPYADFKVVRVRTDLSRTVGFSTTTLRTYIFVTECFGSIATITSAENESEAEFTTAAEVRRLAP